jgi:peptidylprolyl isomerase
MSISMQIRTKSLRSSCCAILVALVCTPCFAQSQPQTQRPRTNAAPQSSNAAPAAAPAPHATASAAARGGADVVARVGDRDVTVAEVRQFVAALPERDQAALAQDPALLSRTLRMMLANQLILKEAKAKKWDSNPAVAAQIERVREQAVVETYLRAMSEPPESYPDEAEVQKAYDANKTAFIVPRRYHLAQIFIALPASPDKAAEAAASKKLAEAQAKLKAPKADFAALAKELSDEKQSAEQGGDIGLIPEDQIRPEIKAEVAGLANGGVSAPIKLNDGWHIVKLIETKPSETRPLADVRAALIQRLRAQRAEAAQRAYLAKVLEGNVMAVNELALSKVFGGSDNPPPSIR